MKTILLNIVLGFLSSALQALSNHDQIMRQLGLAFGPSGIRHWSELSTQEQAAWFVKVPILRQNHTDFPKPLRWIPRTLTFFVLPDGQTSRVLDWTPNTTISSVDIPKRGQFIVLDGYVSYTDPSGLHFRFGFRPDQQGFIEFPSITIKEIQ